MIPRCSWLRHWCLNDIHKAAGGLEKDRPNYFITLGVTQDLIAEILKEGISAIKSSAGRYGGTYVCEELVFLSMRLSSSQIWEVNRLSLLMEGMSEVLMPVKNWSTPMPCGSVLSFISRWSRVFDAYQTEDLVDELIKQTAHFCGIKRAVGRNGGTYVCKKLVAKPAICFAFCA